MAMQMSRLGYSAILSGVMTVTLYLVSRGQGFPNLVWVVTFVVFLVGAQLWQGRSRAIAATTPMCKLRVTSPDLTSGAEVGGQD